MESYIEVSYLLNSSTIFLSVLLAAYSCAQPIKIRKAVSYSSMIAFLGCFLFFPYAWVVVGIHEGIFYLWYFRHKRKTYVLAVAIRWLLYFSMFAWYEGSFHCGMYFIPADTSCMFVMILYIGVYLLLRWKWKDLLTRTNYIYPLQLYTDKQTLQLKGYLDSGNFLCHNELPVIFLDTKYKTYFHDQSIELVMMNTMQKAGATQCYACEMEMEGCIRHPVYVSCTKPLHLPFDCEVLLNMNVMTLG